MTRTAAGVTLSLVLALLGAPVPALAQDSLSLADALSRARATHPDVRQAREGVAAAGHEVEAARAGFLPRVDASEGWQRGDLPVFAFSSLLAQRRFTAADFDVSALNHPDPVDNFRAAVTAEQAIFDGATAPGVRAARLAKDAAGLAVRQAEQRLAAATVAAYGQVQLFEALARAAAAAVTAADEDLARATNRRDAGLATDADVLAVSVHRASMRQRDLQTVGELAVARARLNDLIGAPLDARFALEPMAVVAAGVPDVDALEAEALRARPDVGQARLAVQIAAQGVSIARASFLPQIVARGSLEWNGASFGTRRSGWVVGAEARLNLFHGLADRARVGAARSSLAAREAARDAAERAARLEVRSVVARRASAAARLDVAEQAIAQAREGQRIVRDRYENGLADSVALTRAAESVLDAEAQAIGARTDLALLEAQLDIALGR